MHKTLRIAFCVIFSLAFLVVASTDVEPPAGWGEPEVMTYTMKLTATVQDASGVKQEWPLSQLAVFDNRGVCRGLGTFDETAKNYPVTVTSDMQNAEYLFFQLLNSRTGTIQNIAESLEFQSGAVLENLVLHISETEPRTDAPAWECDASAFDTRRMNIYATVSIDEKLVSTPGSMLSAFQGDTCVGVAYFNPDYPVAYTAALSVANDSSLGTSFTMKVYDAETGAVEEVDWSTPFSTTGEYGTIIEPMTLTAGAIPCEISFKQGYTWFSLNATPADGTPAALLAGLTISDNDLLQKQEGSPATYYNGKWYSAFQLEPGVMYALKKSAGGAETITVKGKKCDTALTVKAGAYKWFGVTGADTWQMTALSHDGGFAANDLIQKQEGSPATYYNGKWYGSFELRPGAGYVIRCANGGTITVASGDQTRAGSNDGVSTRADSNGPWTCQWDAFDTRRMNLFATVKVKGSVVTTIGSQLAAFQAGTCVGTAELTEEGYPVAGTFPLAVCNDSSKGTAFILKIYDAATGKIYDVDYQGVFDTAAGADVTGLINDPLELDFVDPAPGYWGYPEVLANCMTLKAQVALNGSAIGAEGSQLAAFDATGTLRAVATVQNGAFQLNITSDELAEDGLRLKVYDAASDTEYDIPGTLNFAAGSTYSLGYELNAGGSKTYTLELKAGWNLVGMPLHLDTASRKKLQEYDGYRYDASKGAFTILESEGDMLGEAFWLHANKETTIQLNGTGL